MTNYAIFFDGELDDGTELFGIHNYDNNDVSDIMTKTEMFQWISQNFKEGDDIEWEIRDEEDENDEI